MKKEMNRLIEIYSKTEDKILDELSKLKNWSSECDCERDERETIKFIHEGQFDEVMTYCVTCGGYCEK